MLSKSKKYFYTGLGHNFRKCKMGVTAVPAGPFVINKTRGIEVDILADIGQVLNIDFDITIKDSFDGWKLIINNGNIGGNLEKIINDKYFGIGNIDVGMNVSDELTYSNYYFVEPLVFVVPIAEYIPKWRILIAIFTIQMWAICIAIFIIFAIGFYMFSRHSESDINFKRYCFTISYKIIIAQPISKQPNNKVTKILFISLYILSIMLSSFYTCSLTYYLKNPIREKQPTKNTDIIDDFGNFKYYLGGIQKYKVLFNISDNAAIYNYYQTVSEPNDTVDYWLQKVADDRDIWTVSSRLLANYKIAMNSKGIVDDTGRPKIFVFNENLLSYYIAMIARKGHPLLPKINPVIKKLLHGGIVRHYTSFYKTFIQKEQAQDLTSDNTLEALTIRHLEGAFAALVAGYVFGLISLIFEIIVNEKQKRKMKKKRNLVMEKLIQEHKIRMKNINQKTYKNMKRAEKVQKANIKKKKENKQR